MVIASFAIIKAAKATARKRIAFDPAIAIRRSTLSTKPPTGIANNSQGSITIAEIMDIFTGSSVSEIASNGAAVRNKPSAKFPNKLADHSRLKLAPKDFTERS